MKNTIFNSLLSVILFMDRKEPQSRIHSTLRFRQRCLTPDKTITVALAVNKIHRTVVATPPLPTDQHPKNRISGKFSGKCPNFILSI